ncbi:hypothetical protein [Nannocystis bainbridge]|uniref:DoxX family protein n=1 Tax=Nannocystis bainbridge TaxID=2995303 RepID=A0ABT5E3E7_9BACT|nr:hypothetical protein [Nannocystis bainbridge]MDC0720383.1 hypothetical protein [Nannocystis bainbridge]
MTPSSMHARISAFLWRWVLAYFLLYLLLFPLWMLGDLVLPWVHVHEEPWLALVAWLGDRIGLAAVPRIDSDAGDQAYYYVSALARLALAGVLATLWPLVTRTSEPSLRAMDRGRAYAAVYLGLEMLTYGWYKLIPTQMPAIGPERAILPLGDTSPTLLLWSLMGASPAYQSATGLIEVVAGVLLFWRRTRPAGALLTVVVMTNVVLLNYCYDVPVKLHATHLLLLALLLAGPELTRLLAALWGHAVPARTTDPFPIASRAWRRAAWWTRLALVVGMSTHHFVVCLGLMRSTGELAPIGPLHGVYRVIAFTGDGHADMPDERRWLRVALNQEGLATIQTADGAGTLYLLTIDDEAHTLSFAHPGVLAVVLDYQHTGDDTLRLTGTVDGARIVADLQRRPHAAPLTTHGTHWIHDYLPFR